jgi:BioD-like phosphotransacetylase family protein
MRGHNKFVITTFIFRHVNINVITQTFTWPKISKVFIVFKHGITSAEELFPLQCLALGVKMGEYEGDLPGFRNHFSPENNVKIAQALYSAVMTFDPAKNGTKLDLDLLDQDEK